MRRLRRSYRLRLIAVPSLPTQKILAHILHGIIECVAGIAWCEAKLTARLVVIEVPEVFSHLDFIRLDRRREVPLPKQRVDHLRARDRELGREREARRRDFRQSLQPIEKLNER